MIDDILEKQFKANHIHFHMIPSNKFKTITIVIKCKAPLQRDTITKRALLPLLFTQGTKKLPTEKQVMKRLDELYGAVLSVDGFKKGNNHIIQFRLEVANQKFIQNETTVLDEALQLLKEILFDPHVEGSVFPEKVVEREKITLKNKMDAMNDNKLIYANVRLVEEMCKQESYGLRSIGYEEDLSSINGENMYEYYKTVLKEDDMDLYIVGDFDTNELEKKLTSMFKRSQYERSTNDIEEEKLENEPRMVKEVQPIQQAKLHIGYRTNCTYQDENYFSLMVFNGLFGGFPSSKLFTNVREKNSLAYYVASRIESHKGLMIVYSGIEANNEEKARTIIDEQLLEIKKGNITEEEVNEVKQLIISELKETLDHPVGSVELLYQQVIGQKEIPPFEYMNQIERVTRDEVIEVAQRIHLDTVYVLTNDGGDSNEENTIS